MAALQVMVWGEGGGGGLVDDVREGEGGAYLSYCRRHGVGCVVCACEGREGKRKRGEAGERVSSMDVWFYFTSSVAGR